MCIYKYFYITQVLSPINPIILRNRYRLKLISQKIDVRSSVYALKRPDVYVCQKRPSKQVEKERIKERTKMTVGHATRRHL